MAAISSLLAGAALLIGGGAAVANVVQTSQAASSQRRAADAAATGARNKLGLSGTRSKTGARVRVGAAGELFGGAAGPRASSARTGTVGNAIGGLGPSGSIGL